MPETYTGDEGDLALAAGMDIMDGSEDRRDGWRAINKARDYIAQFFESITLTWDAITGKPATFPPSGHSHPISQITTDLGAPYGPALQAALDDIDANADSRVSKSGDTMSGHLFLPGSVAATSGYTTAFINGDGRVSRGASSERYKDDITPIDPAALGDLFPQLHTFVMKDDPGRMERVGYIAERLNESETLRRFVVYARDLLLGEDGNPTGSSLTRDDDGNPIPDSIDFIALLLAQVAQLNERIKELEERP